jgi:branched-chain amino acid transport system substrate-binding protein
LTKRQALSGRRPVHRLSGTILVLAVSVVLAACANTNFLSVLPTILTDTRRTASLPPDRADAAAPAQPAPQTAAVSATPDPAAPRRVDPAPQPAVTAPVPTPPVFAAAAPAPALTPPVVEVDAPVRVALLLPLTGSSAALGESLLNAALMALHDVGDERLMLLPRDTQGLPEGAIDAIEQAVADGAQIILGPVFSASVQAAAQVTRSLDLNMIAFSTDRSVAGDGVYLIGFMPEQQVDRVVSFAVRQGLQRFAAVIPATAYGDTVVGAMQNVAVREGAAITRIEVLTGGPDSFQDSMQMLADYQARRNELAVVRAQLRVRDDEVSRRTLDRLEGRDTVSIVGFDAVMLAEGGDRLRALAPLLPFYDVDPARVRFLGTGLWDEPSLGREPSLVGGWFAGPDPKASTEFRTRYQQLYGKLPPRIASLAYDATALAAVLARTRPQPYYEESALINPAGFAGIDGIFRFATSGISERGLAVLEVRPDGLRVVSPAPVSFDPPTN